MESIIEKYRRLYEQKGGSNVHVELQGEDTTLHTNSEFDSPPPPVRTTINDHPNDVRQMIRQLMDQESHLRNQREKYRMNYYKLEAMQADKEEFAKNFAIIKNLTDQLAPIYIQRKKIEQTGRIETRHEITQDEENQIRRLKYDKKRLIDKKHKLQKKIDTHLSFARGPQNLSQWEADLEACRLEIYDIEEQIKKIEGE
jgi:SMC interacting uncharacterized protein involved in chromosome segregation